VIGRGRRREPARASGVRQPPAHAARVITRELAGWLEPPDPARVRDALDAWGPSTWAAFRRVVTMHGLAAHLARASVGWGLADLLPGDIGAWLDEQDALNAERIRRMHLELAAILAAAARDGIDVMPLKGALLTTMPAVDAHRRPMADLDLLVRPADRARLGAVLGDLGYRREPERNPRPTHDVYLGRGVGRATSGEGEHPGDPRRVEVHVEVKRHLWGWVDDDDLTPALWTGAERREILGQPAIVPRPESLFAHLAIHASSDLLVERGRLVQWLDLGSTAARIDGIAGLPHPRLAYPALRLATRAQPAAMARLDLTSLEADVPRRLARWAASVPLDQRCGLTAGAPPDAPSALAARWGRWRPDPWRLAVAYGELPLAVALARHGATVARQLAGRGRIRRATPADDGHDVR
jgi:hypothetical protein